MKAELERFPSPAGERPSYNLMAKESRHKFVVKPEAAAMVATATRFLFERHIEAYLVGGFVRDGLLGRDTSDIDIAVCGNALEIAAEAAQALGGRMVLLDEVNQTARVVIMENGRQWHIDFSTACGGIEQDLARRDFTVNAIALSPGQIKEGSRLVEVIDTCNGVRDLEEKTIRATGENVFREDPARLLRAVRFAATLGFSIDPSTEALVQRDHHLISGVAGERLRDELWAVLETPNAYVHLRQMDRLGLFTSLFPEMEPTRGVEQPKEHFWDVLNHSFHAVAAVERLLEELQGNGRLLTPALCAPEIAAHFNQEIGKGHTRKALLKLTALFHDIAKPQTKALQPDGRTRFLGHAQEGAVVAGQIMERLRFSSKEIKMAQLMIEQHLRPTQLTSDGNMPTQRAIYRYFKDTGDEGVDTLFLSLADHLATRGPTLELEGWREHIAITEHVLSKLFRETNVVKPPKIIDGRVIMERFGLQPSPRIGELLEAAREAQAAGEINTAEEAVEFLTNRLERS